MLSPLYVAALSLLILNDHVLKTVAPSALSGKLSDFAGLFAVAVMVTYLIPAIRLTSKRAVIAHIGLGALWIVWKLAPMEPVLGALSSWIPSFDVGRVKDPTDLWALTVLPLSLWYVKRVSATSHDEKSRPLSRTVTLGLIISVSFFAFAATSAIREHVYTYRQPIETKASDAEFLIKLERVLAESGFHVTRRVEPTPGQFEYNVEFYPTRVPGLKESRPVASPFARFDMAIGSFSASRTSDSTWRIGTFRFKSSNGSYWVEDYVFAHDIKKALIEPLRKAP